MDGIVSVAVSCTPPVSSIVKLKTSVIKRRVQRLHAPSVLFTYRYGNRRGSASACHGPRERVPTVPARIEPPSGPV
jgi:hypothetical protein